MPNLVDWHEAQKNYFDEMEMHPTLGWRCGLASFPSYITKSRAVAAWIIRQIDEEGYTPDHVMTKPEQWKFWAKEGNVFRKKLAMSAKRIDMMWVVEDWTEDGTVIVAIESTALEALNETLKYAEGEWETAAGGYIHIYHQGYEYNPSDVCDYLILCYLKDRDPKLAEALQSQEGEIVYGCAPHGVSCNKDMESGLELFQYLTGEDWCGREYSAPGPMYYPNRPKLQDLVWVNEGEEFDDDHCSNG